MTHTEQLRAALEKYLDRLDIMFRVGMPEYDMTDMQETLDKARAALAAARTEQAAVPVAYTTEDNLYCLQNGNYSRQIMWNKAGARSTDLPLYSAPAAPKSKDRRAGYIEGLEAAARLFENGRVLEIEESGVLKFSDLTRAIRALIDKEPG